MIAAVAVAVALLGAVEADPSTALFGEANLAAIDARCSEARAASRLIDAEGDALTARDAHAAYRTFMTCRNLPRVSMDQTIHLQLLAGAALKLAADRESGDAAAADYRLAARVLRQIAISEKSAPAVPSFAGTATPVPVPSQDAVTATALLQAVRAARERATATR